MAARAARSLLLVAAVLPAGCARAVNYLEPAAPMHAWRAPAGPASAAADPPPGRPWRVVTFNVAYAIEIERAIGVLRQAAELQSADVVALQEMDAPGTERIARALGLNAVYFPSGVHPKHRRDFGCALLSPWPLAAASKLLLPHGARVSGLRRAAVSATVVRGGERVRVYSLHLPSPLGVSGSARRQQLRTIAADAASRDLPVIVAGDFNSHGKCQELVRAGFDWVTRDVGDSVRLRLLGIGIAGMSYDHVLVKGLRRAAGPRSAGVVADNRGASDHRPVWALVEVLEAAH